MDKDAIDTLGIIVLIATVAGVLALLFYYAIQPSAADGWYDALCEGEVVESVAGTVCLVDGKVELMPQYENREK